MKKTSTNSNFRYDCRSNIDNCTFAPLNDEVEEISYLKKYHVSFWLINARNYKQWTFRERDQNGIQHFSFEIKNGRILCKKYEYYKNNSLEIKRERQLDAINSLKEKQEKLKKKKKMKSKNYDARISTSQQNPRTKMLIDFDRLLACSTKSLTVNKNNEIKAASRFFNCKILMFAKLSLMIFIYDVVETFYFQDQIVKEIYKKYKIKKCLPCHVLAETDSTCFMFSFICEVNCSTLDYEI